MFSRLGPWCHDRRRLVLGLWIAALFISNGIASAVGDDYRQDFTLPGAESTEGFDLLNANFEGQGAGQTGTIVFQAEQGVDDPEVQAAMEALFDDVATMPGVSRVESPYDERQRPDLRGRHRSPTPTSSSPRTSTSPTPADVRDADPRRRARHRRSAGGAGRVHLRRVRGAQLRGHRPRLRRDHPHRRLRLRAGHGPPRRAWRSSASASAGAGVILFSNVIEVPEFAPFIGIMIGLGVGIDYALLIITRYREQLHAGHTVRESVAIAMDTAGRSVLFAGATVVVSVLGMLLMGIGFVQGLAVTASVTVALTVSGVAHAAPGVPRLRGGEHREDQAAGLIAATLVAVGLVGFGLDVAPLMAAFPAALVVIIARVLRPGRCRSR